MLETMAKGAGRLRSLIEDLLLISQMDAGSLRLDLEPTGLAGVVRRAAESVSGLADARASASRSTPILRSARSWPTRPTWSGRSAAW